MALASLLGQNVLPPTGNAVNPVVSLARDRKYTEEEHAEIIRQLKKHVYGGGAKFSRKPAQRRRAFVERPRTRPKAKSRPYVGQAIPGKAVGPYAME